MNPIYSYHYCIPYFIFFIILWILVFYEFKKINSSQSILQIRIITLCLCSIFIGLRGFVYTDWVNYYPLFKSLPTIWEVANYKFENEFIEPGFTLFTIIIKSIYPDYFFFVFICTIIDLIILDSFFHKKTQYYVFAFLLFFLFNGIWIEFNLLRNAKSLMLFILSIKYIEKSNFKKYFLLNLLGVFFHSSSCIYIILYPILKAKFLTKYMLPIFIVGNIIFLGHIEYIKPLIITTTNIIGGRFALYAEVYLNNTTYANNFGLSIGFLERTITFIFIYIYKDYIIKKNEDSVIYINMFMLYSIVYLYMSEVYILIQRLSLLFIISYPILYPRLFNLCNIKSKYLIIICFFIYSLLRISISNNNIFAKYDNLLWGVESFEVRQQNFKYDIEIK